ncbi:valine--tRNA ligase [Entomospira entomophila]|uniref:Valine--tRNA ligase n=1 Tax=Entomospira entomophila TaxID=2719988 RepID=A0A968G7L6_9SPIO|nr:valine--tRNA ligase [Entomospira entomophilus]NIZ40092.1 valine--tRNA ligase [Entomospira entomophilus]WDI35653.1 valine--tRNA ligase [Entomospira entomophilus]
MSKITAENFDHEFPKQYQPKEFEKELYRRWEELDLFRPEQRFDNPEERPFVVVIPPPNVTGVLHMGHGLNGSLQDILIRYQRMLGRKTLWVPGTDHAGIATQHVAEKELREKGKTRHDLGREEFLQYVWQVKDRHHRIISQQLREIGSSCDWNKERFTFDEGLSKAVREAFVRMYEAGDIYQGEYLVNWCMRCTTALSDDEVEYQEEDSFLYHVRYQIVDSDDTLVVATSRPETIFGDVALAVHPEDERYQHVIGKEVRVPMTERVIKVIADSYVDREFGSAVLKVTPSHDPNDFEIGKRHNLASINIFTESGELNYNTPTVFQGLSISDARTRAVELLEELGLLVKKDPLHHRVGKCYRCQTTIEPYLSKQWFVKMQHMANLALQAHQDGKISFYPKRWENTYTSWLSDIRDWCISRQLWWGHRIPAWYCQDCGEISVSRDDIHQCTHCKSENIKQDEDVLDTWFSSWLWPFSVFGWPEKSGELAEFYPTSTLVTAYDIIFFWVARMIMAGLNFMGEVPFKDIYITPLVRDKQGRKMSKSLGNGIDPLEIVATDGADALRFTIAYLSTQGQDLPLDKETFKMGGRFANKIWNATRFLLGNLVNISYNPAQAKNSPLDDWIYGQLNRAVKSVHKAFEQYRFDDASHAIYDYFWSDFCDWYLEALKASFYAEDINEKERALAVSLHVLEESLRLMHPFLPFISEELYQKLPNKLADYLIIAPYPTYQVSREQDNHAFHIMKLFIGQVRAMRTQFSITGDQRFAVSIYIDNKELRHQLSLYREMMIRMTKLEEIHFATENFSEEQRKAQVVVTLTGEDFIALLDMRQFINMDAELAKIEKETKEVTLQLERATAKLSNENFVQRASPDAVAKERERVIIFKEQLMHLKERKRSLL